MFEGRERPVLRSGPLGATGSNGLVGGGLMYGGFGMRFAVVVVTGVDAGVMTLEGALVRFIFFIVVQIQRTQSK